MPEHDIVVIGGGIAGLTTATRAAELGLAALVLEQGTAQKYLCNTRYTGGTFHVCMHDIMAGEPELLQALRRTTDGVAKPELVGAVAADGPKAIRWMQAQGVRFMKASGSAYHNWVLAPPGRSRPGLDWEGRSGDVLLGLFEARLTQHGGRLERGARVRALVMQGGRCVGVRAEHGGATKDFCARAVVIADGGFQADPELVGRHIAQKPERLRQRNAGTGMGDGLRMAAEAGAALSDLSRFYGHLLSIDAFRNDRLWPYPYLDALAGAGIAVGADGRRFADEGRSGVFLANAVARLPDPLSARIVFDTAIWEGAGRHGIIPANPHLKNEGATLHTAQSLPELAAKAGLPAEPLLATIRGFNDAVAGGGLAALEPPRSGSAARAIAAPPFYAAPICAGITYTMGGIVTDQHGRVLGEDGSIIAGLYAVGATTGGLEGGPQAGYVGGLAKSAIFGLRAAEHAAGNRG